MIKDLILKYKNVAFMCNTKNDFINFVEESSEEIEYSMGIGLGHNKRFVESKEYILDNHLKIPYNKKYILIRLKRNEGYDEYQFYSRDSNTYNMFNDWEKYKTINYSYLLRKQKIKKIKNKING